MIYLSGAAQLAKVREVLPQTFGKLGYICTPAAGNRSRLLGEYPCWAADNGCYSQGDNFNLPFYLNWLRLHTAMQHKCLFATAPDVVGDARATWERSSTVLPVLRGLGYKAALVAQDGIEDLAIDWAAFDCLFTGGSTAWKLSEAAYGVAKEAKQQGKWVHMGRVNSRRRLIAAAVSGYDSADGTHIAFGPDKRIPDLLAWLAELRLQGRFTA